MTYHANKKRALHIRIFSRIILDILIVVIALAGPWWLALFGSFFLIFFFKAYELIVIGILLDSMYTRLLPHNIFGAYTYTVILCVLISFSSFFAPFMRKDESWSGTY
jgi:hypothetical protein